MGEARSRRQQQAAATAEQLLAAAREVFESRGYVGATVGAITEAANTAHGTFYLYFKNKEDAFAKVMASVADDLWREGQPALSETPYGAVHAAIRGYLAVYSEHRGLWRCLLEGMHRSPALEEMWLELRRPFIDRIQRTIEHLAAAGSIRPMNAALAAEALGAMVEWTSFCFVELGEPAGVEASVDAMTDTLADLFHNAVYGRESAGR